MNAAFQCLVSVIVFEAGLKNADQFESSQGFIVGGHLPFALQDVNGHRRLVVGSR